MKNNDADEVWLDHTQSLNVWKIWTLRIIANFWFLQELAFYGDERRIEWIILENRDFLDESTKQSSQNSQFHQSSMKPINSKTM